MGLRQLGIVTFALAALVTAGCGTQGSEESGGTGTEGNADGPRGTVPAPPGGPVSGHEPSPELAGRPELPPGHPPLTGPGAIAPPPPGSGTGAAGLTWSVPAGWKEEAPTSPMRRAQFRVTRAGGDAEDGECLVFYFGPGQGGTPESNAMRWVDQFEQPDGSTSEGKARIGVRTIGGRETMFVEVKGTFRGSTMPGMAGAAPKPGHALIGAIVSGPDAPWFFKLTGPERTVEANRAAFESLIASVRPAEGS